MINVIPMRINEIDDVTAKVSVDEIACCAAQNEAQRQPKFLISAMKADAPADQNDDDDRGEDLQRERVSLEDRERRSGIGAVKELEDARDDDQYCAIPKAGQHRQFRPLVQEEDDQGQEKKSLN